MDHIKYGKWSKMAEEDIFKSFKDSSTRRTHKMLHYLYIDVGQSEEGIVLTDQNIDLEGVL